MTEEKKLRRLVRVHTLQGMFTGQLETSPAVSTLGEMNIVGNNFLTIQEPQVISGDWTLENCPLLIAKSSILFLVEEESTDYRPAYTAQTGFFMPAPLRLWVKGYSIQGHVHVSAGISAMTRLKQTNNAFTALTQAIITGEGEAMEANFVGVNRSHILAAQELLDSAFTTDSAPESLEPEPALAHP